AAIGVAAVHQHEEKQAPAVFVGDRITAALGGAAAGLRRRLAGPRLLGPWPGRRGGGLVGGSEKRACRAEDGDRQARDPALAAAPPARAVTWLGPPPLAPAPGGGGSSYDRPEIKSLGGAGEEIKTEKTPHPRHKVVTLRGEVLGNRETEKRWRNAHGPVADDDARAEPRRAPGRRDHDQDAAQRRDRCGTPQGRARPHRPAGLSPGPAPRRRACAALSPPCR